MIQKTFKERIEVYAITNVRVIDGDTIETTILLPFGCTVQKRIRLKGWWADEIEGLYRSAGLEAALRFERFIEGKVLWLHCPSERLDRYGRVLAHLMHEGRIISGREVLGDFQLTEAIHKEHRDQNARQKASSRDWQASLAAPDRLNAVKLPSPSPETTR